MNRAILTTLVSFFTVVVICPVMIPFLQRLKLGQAVRELGPQTHYKKAGTPTMGGIAMLAAIAAASLLFSKKGSSELHFAIIITCLFALIGFLDDYIKIIQKNAIGFDKGVSMTSLGMSPSHKFILQCMVATALAFYASYHPGIGSAIRLPFLSGVYDLGMWFIPFVIFSVVAVVNAVNLTDGLDGLACGVTMIVIMFFLINSAAVGSPTMSIFCASVAGACLGFLCYNFNPAKVFMGDTGSMALGGAVASVAVLTKSELFILIAGAIYVIETVSVALQVLYFKSTHGKRLFKMAPIHHHFELCGWEETRVVMIFWIFSAVCVMISIMAAGINIY